MKTSATSSGSRKRIAFDLDVAFLHDVEQADLNFPGEVRQFIDGEEAAVSAGQQSVMHGHFAGEIMPAARRFDGIDVANQVSDGHVRRGQLFHVAIFGREISDGRIVAFARDQLAAALADRIVRIVVDLAAGDERQMRDRAAR